MFGSGIAKELGKKVGGKIGIQMLKKALGNVDKYQIIQMKTKEFKNNSHAKVVLVHNKQTGKIRGMIEGAVCKRVKRGGACYGGNLKKYQYGLSAEIEWREYSYLFGLISGKTIKGLKNFSLRK
jgi:hypothetical protein